jgi:hypothetical protein
MDNFYLRYGERLALKAFNSGSFAPLKDIYTDLNSPDLNIKTAGWATWVAATIEIARLMDATQKAGIATFTPPPPTPDELTYLAITNPKRFRVLERQVIASMREMHRAGPSIRASYPAPGAKDQAAAPLEVRIVGMPSRDTTSTIERDGSGEISGSHQVEKDL